MNLPPLFISLTLLFWGWEARLLPWAIVGSVILELPRLVRWRWEFSATDMNRVWDLCEVLFLGAMIYGYATTDIAAGPARFLPWLPIVFFPFVAATVYSAEDRVRFSTYFWLWRRPGRAVMPTQKLGWFVPYWYFVVCLIATSMVNARDLRFYTGTVLLGAWLLWRCRNRAVPAWAWGIVFVAAIFAGFGGQIGLVRLQTWVEGRAGQLFDELTSPDTDLTQSRTAIGMVGKLKLSDRILLRVETDGNQRAPELLRKASFDTYRSNGAQAIWSITSVEFGAVAAGRELGNWVLAAGDTSAVVRVATFQWQGTGIVPTPSGPTVLEGLLAATVQTNRYGSVRVREAPPLVRYAVRYGKTSTIDAPPSPADLEVPAAEAAPLRQIAGELGLEKQTPQQILWRVDNFFETKFKYSRYLKAPPYDPTGRRTPLGQFLLHDRAGHCEYFATATTLLLRTAGIPTRYATGFAVPEPEKGGRVHLVRARHAHAWTLAFVDGHWQNFDTTPAIWNEVEDSQRSIWQPVADLFSWLKYQFARWRYYGDRDAAVKLLRWPALVLLLWILTRLFGKKRRQRLADAPTESPRPKQHGLDSEFYQIERQLAARGSPRRPDETVNDWIDRLASTAALGAVIPPLCEIVSLHYAYRFDPQGINAAQRRELSAKVEEWLAGQDQRGRE